MATFQDIQLKNESTGAPVSANELPEQQGDRTPPLQPGLYRFELPSEQLIRTKAEVFERTCEVPDGQGGTVSATRFSVRFGDDCPLKIVQSPEGARNGEAFRAFLSNQERYRDKAKSKFASDMDYLFQAIHPKVVSGEVKLDRGNNPQYQQLLLECAGKTFTAKVGIGWYSNPKSDIFAVFEDDKGETSVQPVEGVTGDGKRYYARDIGTDENGVYPTTVEHVIEVAEGGELVKYTQILWGQNDLSNFKA